MTNWVEIVDEWAGQTWDYPVECGLSLEDGKRVAELGYYGKLIRPEHAQMIADGVKYPEHKFVLHYEAVDGFRDTYEGDDEDAARTFIGKWLGQDFEFTPAYAVTYDGIGKVYGEGFRELLP